MEAKLELDEKKIELLIRSALIDDATNAAERLGALLAEIGVDEDGDVWVSFEGDYWPEDKDPVQAMAVAKLLGIELEQTLTIGTPPFHWPALAGQTNSTAEYVSVLLDAYAGRGIDLRRQ